MVMEHVKVKGTKWRNGVYHYNIPIPAKIQHLYPARKTGKFKAVRDGTMKTSDPRTATKMVADEYVVLRRQSKAVDHKTEQDKIAATLDPADARLLAELGGVEGLLRVIKEQRKTAAFVVAGQGAHYQTEDEIDGGYTRQRKALGGNHFVTQVENSPPIRVNGGAEELPSESHAERMERTIQQHEAQARLDTLTADTRRMRAILEGLGEAAPTPPPDLNEGMTGVREMATALVEDRR
jgi:hypothetical protein